MRTDAISTLNGKDLIALKHDEPDQPERLIKENEEDIDIRFQPIPKDPRRQEALWDNILSGIISGVIASLIVLIFA